MILAREIEEEISNNLQVLINLKISNSIPNIEWMNIEVGYYSKENNIAKIKPNTENSMMTYSSEGFDICVSYTIEIKSKSEGKIDEYTINLPLTLIEKIENKLREVKKERIETLNDILNVSKSLLENYMKQTLEKFWEYLKIDSILISETFEETTNKITRYLEIWS